MPVVLLSVLRFFIALVQMAGLLAYFHQHLGWELLPTALLALAMTLLVPIAATIFGFMGAIYAWSWPWWIAFLVFLPGLAMALTALAGASVLGLLSAFVVKRFGARMQARGPFSEAGQRPFSSGAESHTEQGTTIEGEVISSRVDPDGK